MPSDEQQTGRSFKVQDRRRFSETGEARTDVEEQPSSSEPESSRPSSGAAESTASPISPEPSAADMSPSVGAEINFTTFVISLSAQALAHLGEIPDPVHRSVHVDLEAARQVIDILGMLREKTKGNLDSAEDPLLENILYDLRMKYVERVRDR